MTNPPAIPDQIQLSFCASPLVALRSFSEAGARRSRRIHNFSVFLDPATALRSAQDDKEKSYTSKIVISVDAGLTPHRELLLTRLQSSQNILLPRSRICYYYQIC